MIEAVLESIRYLFSNDPPSWAIWIGIIIIPVTIGILNLIQFWRKRARLKIQILTAERHCLRFTEKEAKNWSIGMLRRNGGDPKSVFSVLEFTITNSYDRDIVVGRINAFGWIFSDQYSSFIYDHKRDYRIFDLFSRKQSSLTDFNAIPPDSTLGFRLEVYQDQRPRNSRVPVDLPKYFTIDIQTDVGRKQLKKKSAWFILEPMYLNN